MEIKVFNRDTAQIYIEKQFKNAQLKFLYNTVLGRIVLKLFIAGKTYSKHHAKKNDSFKSVKKIQPFIDVYKIDMTQFEIKEYKSFNEFFIRNILPEKRPIARGTEELIAVADSKLMYYKIEDDLSIKIKNRFYTVEELIQNRELAGEYKNGICLVFRLTVDDYHHYCFCDEGRIESQKYINGQLHTVGPISARRYKVYAENCREYSLLNTVNFGRVVQMEVGALLVGKIVNKKTETFSKGEEKGYFEMGGSTIVILLKENTVKIDEDILFYSSEGIETKVKLGERIGKRLC